jgi:hypothetical protein
VASEKKKTGLGVDAIFSQKLPEPTQPEPAQPEPAKIRTTIMLAADVLILLNRLKEQSIVVGNRQTQGEIIEEAIRTLARIKNVKA